MPVLLLNALLFCLFFLTDMYLFFLTCYRNCDKIKGWSLPPIITRIKIKINHFMLKPDSHHCFAATIRQKWPWILVFLPCAKKIWLDILLSTYSKPKIILKTKSSWQWWRPKRPCLSSWSCTAVQWSLDFWPRFLWWCMYIHNRNACYSPTHMGVTDCHMAAMQVSNDITSDLLFFFKFRGKVYCLE